MPPCSSFSVTTSQVPTLPPMPSSKTLHSSSRDLRDADEETTLLGAQKTKTFNQLSQARLWEVTWQLQMHNVWKLGTWEPVASDCSMGFKFLRPACFPQGKPILALSLEATGPPKYQERSRREKRWYYSSRERVWVIGDLSASSHVGRRDHVQTGPSHSSGLSGDLANAPEPPRSPQL